jgi:hypothetical protein
MCWGFFPRAIGRNHACHEMCVQARALDSDFLFLVFSSPVDAFLLSFFPAGHDATVNTFLDKLG